MLRHGKKAVAPLALVACLVGLPEVGHVEESHAVRLDTIHVTEHEATARLDNGQSAPLTLDSQIQRDADRLLHAARPMSGAIVVVDFESGELRALSTFKRRGARPGNPLTAGVPAASVFKIVTTTALFEHADLTPQTKVCFAGGNHAVNRNHLAPPPADQARCDQFGSALGYSRNAVYAQLAFKHLLHQDLLSTAERFGFNRPLSFEASAQVGTLDLPYNDLQFARAAAGFVGSRLTPLGAAHITYAIANGGVAAQLRLLRDDEASGRISGERLMSANSAWRLTRMMEVTVHSGTSLDAFTNDEGKSYLGPVRVAGKTGTLRESPQSATTSWFTGFAPSREPRYVVTVMLENGRIWRQRANEVARDVLRVLFANERGVTSPFDKN